VIPCYNSAPVLARAIDSALAQDTPTEIIVVDDGSTDASAEVARSYGPRGVTCLFQQNAGQGAARNAGLERCRGEYVAFLDADDFWRPEFGRTLQAFLEEHRECVAASCQQEILHLGRHVRFNPRGGAGIDERGAVLPDFFEFWAKEQHLMTGAVLLRREVIATAGGQLPDLRMSQDLEYWAHIATFGPWGFVPRPLFVTDGMANAAVMGWGRKYEARRRLCPTVEQWQRRIRPRVPEHSLAFFRQVRGTVAAGFTHAMVLAGRDGEALETVRRYGASFPGGRLRRLLRLAAAHPRGLWPLTCRMLRLWDATKPHVLRLRGSRRAMANGGRLGS
jgi:hypothetical protein